MIQVAKVPEILLIHLKKFKRITSNRSSKVNTIVEFDLNHIDVDVAVGVDNVVYEAIAIGNHIGGIDSGHCTATVKRGNQWVSCNDSTCTSIETGSVVTKDNYLIFCKRKDVSWDTSDALGTLMFL